MTADESPIKFLVEASRRESFEHFRDYMEQSMLFKDKTHQREFAITRALKNGLQHGLFVEFGVAAGHGCNQFGNILEPLDLIFFGFDSFEGLQEDWTGIQTGRSAGAFSQNGVLPLVPSNVSLIKGWVQETLPKFLQETIETPFAFIHMDMDTYTPTKFALESVYARLTTGSIILFDELYGYPGWRHHEYKALLEILPHNSYRFISFSKEAVAIQIT